MGEGARMWLTEATASILDHCAATTTFPTHRAGQGRSLTQGTKGWATLSKVSAAVMFRATTSRLHQ